MLFHIFASQDERRKFGGSDFLELQPCRLARDAQLKEIVSVDAIEHWKDDSLYIHGDDVNEFYIQYGNIFQDGYYANGNRGIADWCGINYYPLEETQRIAALLKRERPTDFQVLLDWLSDAEKYNGIYLLGM